MGLIIELAGHPEDGDLGEFQHLPRKTQWTQREKSNSTVTPQDSLRIEKHIL
jgi:hypothetical protein